MVTSVPYHLQSSSAANRRLEREARRRTAVRR